MNNNDFLMCTFEKNNYMKFSVILLLIFLSLVSSCETDVKPIDNVVEDTVVIVKPIDSLNFLSTAIQGNTQNAKLWFDRANYFMRQGSISDALIDMTSAVRLDSVNAIYRVKLADLQVSSLKLEGALDNYEYVLSIDSANANAYVGMGRVFALLNNPGMATGYLNKAYQINPHLSEAYFLEGLIYRADYDETKREESIKRALSSFQTATEQKPDFYAAYIEMGVINHRMGNDIALDYYNTAIDIAPKSIEAWYNKGMYFQDKKMYSEARTCYKTISDIDSLNSNALYNQGYIKMLFEKDLDSAIYFFNYVTQLDTNHFNAYNNLGLSLERKGEIEKAKNAYRKAIDINPDFKLAKKNLNFISK